MRSIRTLRKSHMTLLETLIAVSLLSILLVFVFGIFREISELTRMTEKAQKESFRMRYVETRLGFIFERIVNENENDKSRTFFFYTQPENPGISKSTSLILTFNNEVRKDPAFSGDVLGRLYLDDSGRFCLATWPIKQNEPPVEFHEEVLMDRVRDVAYSFYSAPVKVNDTNQIVSRPIGGPENKNLDKDTWLSEWLFSYKQMPCIVKITLKMQKESDDARNNKKNDSEIEHVFYFVLPSSKNPIHYPKGEIRL